MTNDLTNDFDLPSRDAFQLIFQTPAYVPKLRKGRGVGFPITTPVRLQKTAYQRMGRMWIQISETVQHLFIKHKSFRHFCVDPSVNCIGSCAPTERVGHM